MPDTILILLVFVGFMVLLLFIAVFILLRRRAARQQQKESTTRKKKQSQKRKKTAAKQGSKQKPKQPAKKSATAKAKRAPQSKSAAPAPSKSVVDASPPPPAAATDAPPAAPTAPSESPNALTEAQASGKKIRILIVDDNIDTRENVSRLLYFEDDLEVIGQAVNGREGIEMSTRLKPHIVLMDINMPDMDGITATEHLSAASAYSQVIIMSVQAEPHYMKRAMAAGARDFQPKPFTSDELVNCIRRVYDIGRPFYKKMEESEELKAQQVITESKAKKSVVEGDVPVIAVFSGKGGVGISALAVNLAIALQQKRGDIGLMDADLQFGDVSVNLNIRPTRTMTDLVHEGAIDTELVSDVVLAHDSGLKVLLGPTEPQLADMIKADMIGPIIAELKNLFKLVIIDTGSQLNDITLQVLENVDYILVVTTPELPAIKSAKLFLQLADKLKFSPDQLGVVINKFNEPGGVRPDQIAKVLKLKQLPYQIPDDSRLYLAMYKGASIVQEDENAPSAQAISLLADALLQKLKPVETADSVESVI